MKRLKDFKKNEVSLKSIWGGQPITTESTTKNADGCTVKTSDVHYDNNNNGKLDKGDSYIECSKTICA